MKHRRISLLAAVVCLAMLLFSCSPSSGTTTSAGSSSAPNAYHKISAEEAKKLMDAGGVTIVDVRRADEYATGHIPGAINVPNESISDKKPDALPDLNAKLIVYCRTGVRSKQASDKLVKIGYTDVNDMGGIADWTYDTISGADAGASSMDEMAAEKQPSGILSAFSATDLEGNKIDQSILKDYDLVMVNVWATYCAPCLSEMPELGQLAKEYSGKKVRVIGMISDVLNSDGSVSSSQIDTAKEVVKQTNASYLHIVPSRDLFGLLSQITSVPTTFFVDKNGEQVGTAYLGARDKKEWASIVESTLAEVSM